MQRPKYCRILNREQALEIHATGVIAPSESCWPYPPKSTAFLFDQTIATTKEVADTALAKHIDFGGQEIWSVEFDDPALQTEPDKTPSAWHGSIAVKAPFRIDLGQATFKKLYSAVKVGP